MPCETGHVRSLTAITSRLAGVTDPLPHLRAVTRPLDEMPDLVALADPHDPLVWVRGDRGCVGIGSLVRLEFQGPDRFAEAAKAWREISRLVEVDDPVGLPGTGLVALGTFTFTGDASPHTHERSILVIPRRIIARHGSVAWVTDISLRSQLVDDLPSLALPQPATPGSWAGIDLLDGSTAAADAGSAVAAYLDGVREANDRITRGEVEKVVLARQLSAALRADSDLRVPLQRLADRYVDCWTFAIDGLFGASPETLIRSTSGAVSARVLAGTRPRRTDDPISDARTRNDLLRSDKDQHEHAFAVQSVVTALAPYLPDLRTSEEPFALELPNVWHLATDLGATLETAHGANAIELVGALHPTAAVAGTPTREAVAVISELEPFDRGRYAGAVGWIDQDGDGEWVIALRCAQLGPDMSGTRMLTASAGGGIVLGSDPEHELAETVSKFRPIADAIAPRR